jgi:hypothetical protein
MVENLGIFTGQINGLKYQVIKITEDISHRPLKTNERIFHGTFDYKTACGQDLTIVKDGDERAFMLFQTDELILED